MKFLCPSCKAKYQIADEKVIGRTVKMKCRHCGHLIEINEAVIGGGERSTTVPPANAHASGRVADELPVQPSLVPSKAKPPPKPGTAASHGAETGAEKLVGAPPQEPRTVGVRKLSSPMGGGVRAIPASAEKLPSARDPEPKHAVKVERLETQAATPAPDRVSQDGPVPSSQRASSPGPARISSTTNDGAKSLAFQSSGAAAKSAARAERADPLGPSAVRARVGTARHAIVEQTTRATTDAEAASASVDALSDALAGAFTKAVTGAAEHPLAGDEWYVGVNDQPIGPIRLAEIRDRAARGEVTADCLVWRDGFEDWKPLMAFPELVAVVEEGIASLRSQRPPVAALATGPAAPLAIQAQPAASTAATGQSGIGATTSAIGAVGPAVSTTTTPFDDDALAVPGLAPPKIPVAAWLAVFMALALGVTIGLVVLKPAPPKEIVKYVQVPATSQQPGGDPAAQTHAANGQPEPAAGNHDAVASSTDKRSTTGVRKSGPAAAGSDAPTAAVASTDVIQGLKGLQGLQGLGGPRTGPGTDIGASGSSRQQLDSATLSRTVSRYTASVKRSCWQPALDTRAPDAATSARISANIVVAPSGKVQNVTVSPDPKGYRGLSTCIQSRVRNWEFPPAGGSTEFNVPFVFAAQ